MTYRNFITALTATDGTAIYGTDYSSPSNRGASVTFGPGVTTVSVTYRVLLDSVPEDMESFTLALALTGTTDTDMFATITEPSSSTVYLTDCTGRFVTL